MSEDDVLVFDFEESEKQAPVARLKRKEPPQTGIGPRVSSDDENTRFGQFIEIEEEEEIVSAKPEAVSMKDVLDHQLFENGLVYKDKHFKDTKYIVRPSGNIREEKFKTKLENAEEGEEKDYLTKIWKRYLELQNVKNRENRLSVSKSSSNAAPAIDAELHMHHVQMQYLDIQAMEGEEEEENMNGGGGHLSRKKFKQDSEDELDQKQALEDYEQDDFCVADDAKEPEPPSLEEMDVGTLETMLTKIDSKRQKKKHTCTKSISQLERELQKYEDRMDQREATLRLIISRKTEEL